MSDELAPGDHIFRHIKKSWIDDDFINPAAFTLRSIGNGQFEDGLSVNWVEYFGMKSAREAVTPLVKVLEGKGRKIGGQSRFAVLNVKRAIEAASQYTSIKIALHSEDLDQSHTLIKGYEQFNAQVAEAIHGVIIHHYAAKEEKTP